LPVVLKSSTLVRQAARLERELRRKQRVKLLLGVAVVAAVGLVVVLGILLFGGGMSSDAKATDDVEDAEASASQPDAPTEAEIRAEKAVAAGAAPGDPNITYLPTPLIATRDSLKIHSPISANHITEIEFHQASFDTALQLTPLLTVIDAQKAADQRGTRHIPADQQPTGDEPLIGETVSTWRLDSYGDEMTSVDVGALAGTDVYAPITGTVVKIKNYSLYGLLDDYEIHIQSRNHPGLDVVMLHIEDLLIKEGDEVIGGVTRIAKIRAIGAIIDNNLANFTAPGDPGDHCHVQVNDATREDYKGLEDALNIFG
jgi:murein DD-endopeptidase MepM/ murein hydrolase activator NlpD